MSHDAHQQEGDREDWYRFDAPHLEFYYDLNKEKVAAETGVEPEFSFERPSFDNPEQRRSRTCLTVSLHMRVMKIAAEFSFLLATSLNTVQQAWRHP